jgi:excisionase family DNA binding protein
MKPRDRLLRIDEVALILRLSPRTVRRMVAAAHFKVCRVSGRPLRIFESSVYDYMERAAEMWSEQNGLPEDSVT